jgi:hypothetical protein
MKNVQRLLPAAMIAALMFSCEIEDTPPMDTGFLKGVYIVNEGTYTQNNGSVSYYNPEEKVIVNGIFESVNGRPLGDVVQSMAIANDTLGFIVVNFSSKVEIVGLKTFKTKADPIQVTYPRYFMQVDPDKGYLTSGSLQGYVYIIDISEGIKTDSIAVGYGPETMVITEEAVYVANSGGWSADSTISIIDYSSDVVIDTLKVGLCPVDLTIDSEGYLWVYCRGYTNWADINTAARLQKINLSTGTVVWESTVGLALDYSVIPVKFTGSADGKVIYYLRPDGVYSINAENPQLQTEPLIEGSYYGVDVNPNDGNIYLFETSFTSNGTLKIFDVQGNQIAEGMVGVGPGSAIFNY